MAKTTKSRIAEIKCPNCGETIKVRDKPTSKAALDEFGKDMDKAFDKVGEALGHAGEAFKKLFK